MNIISDFSDIARRMNRKQEFDDKGPPAPPLPGPSCPAAVPWAAAAVKTLQSLGYTYTDGAEMWKPPLGNGPAIPSWPIVDVEYKKALFGLLKAQDLRRQKTSEMQDYLRGVALL